MHSLRAGMLITIILATALGVSMYFILHALIISWVDNNYNSASRREDRYNDYFEDLQEYVKDNAVSSTDTSAITRWVRSNRNVYVFLYKDDHLFYDGIIEGEKPDTGTQKPDTGGDIDAPDGEGEKPDASPDTDSSQVQRPGAGITVEYPTREEILEAAQKNGLLPLELSDGSLLVSLVDFTDYIYYDAANIISLVAALITPIIILMLYFHRITYKISGIARDVSRVYEEDINQAIRTSEGDDELSELSRNVERMRTSMLESLEKEKEALNANSELITSMSHDIRTPLTVLLGYIDIMKKDESGSESMREYIRASENTVLKLKELSDDMFRYFLVFGGGEIKPELADYGAKTLMEQMLGEHILLLEERGYDVKFTVASSINDEMCISTDAPKLMRVIDNLFSNIYKYADIGQPINVCVSLPESGKISLLIANYVKETSADTESNRVGLKTCRRLCDALDIAFTDKITAVKGKRIFSAKLVLDLG